MSERNFRIRLLNLDLNGPALNKRRSQRHRAHLSCNYSDGIRSFREVNEFTFDAFFGAARKAQSALRGVEKKPSMRFLAGDGHNAKVSYGIFSPSQSNGKGLSPQIETTSAHHFSRSGEGRGVE